MIAEILSTDPANTNVNFFVVVVLFLELFICSAMYICSVMYMVWFIAGVCMDISMSCSGCSAVQTGLQDAHTGTGNRGHNCSLGYTAY